MEGNEQLYAQKVSDCVKDFVLRYNIDEAAAVALRSLPLGQQQEVTSQITGATNPSAVLLSRIKRLKQGQPPLNRAPVAGGAAVAAVSPEATAATGLAGVPAATAAPPPPPDDTRAAVEAFLERHCINADACQSIWELSPEQQRLVISSDLVPTTGDAFDALMDRISEILQGAKHSQYEADHQRHQKVSDFLERYEISADVALALRSLPLERQVEITAPDLTGAKNPSAVLMSRIQRKGHGKGDGVTSARGEVNAFLQAFQFDDDAKRSFLELRPEQQNLIMRDDGVGDYRRCRNPSAYLMSRIRSVKEGGLPTPAVSSEGQWWEPPSGKTDVVETFLRRHNIDDGGREALHQLPAELQLRVLAHDHEIGQGGRNPSQHLVSLVGMAWAGTLGPPVVPPMAPMPPPMAPIGAAVTPQPVELPQASLALEAPGEATKAAKAREAEGEEAPAKKRKLEKLEEDEQLNNSFNDHLPLAVEGFLRLNGIDAKSCRAMRRLSPAAQQKLIGMDIRHRRNPSAFLWTQIQKLRDNHDDEEEVNRPERPRPPPVERQKPPALQNTLQNKAQKPQTSYPSRFSKPPSPPSPPKRREKGPKADVAFFLIRHGKGSYVPPSVEVCGGAPLTCGRARHHNDIEVLAQHVSKRHLEFHVQPGSSGEPILMVRDLSSNGTWVRGEKIQPGRLTRVVPGDIISLLPPNGEDVPAFQVMENADSVKAERMDEAMDHALAKPVAPAVDAADGEVAEWIRSIGGGGKLSQRLIEEIEDSYDHLRQISENYRQNINEFLDVHAVEDADEQEALVKDIEYESKFNPETGLSVPQAAIWMVFITIFMDTLAATISTPALPYYARSFHVNNAAVGYLYASWSFTSAFCAPVLGQLADKFGRRSVLLASLLGAGLANLGQACAGTYYQLLGWRAFSGIWAAVGNSAQVYLSDVCSPLVLPDFMSKLSAVPSLAMTFGPGLGGGLSKFGLEIPVLVDGLLSLLAAGLCFIYLPESPVWLQSRGQAAATASDAKAPAKVTSIPAGVRVLAISGFFSGINFGVVVSMTAIFLDAKLQFDSLHVGFTFVLSALATLATSIWITGFVQKSVGLKCCAVLGSLLNGLLSIAMTVIPGAWPTIIVMCLARVGMTLRAATNGTILANFTDPSNRGTIFAQQQFATNMGRLVGPVVAGHLAVGDPVLLPILFGSCCGLISGLILLAVPMPEGPKEVKQQRLRGFTDLGGAESVLELEYGTAQDCEELGKFMGDLLSQRRYRWISRKKAIYCMLDKLLPELSADVGDHLEDLQRLMKHVELIQKDFEGVQNRDVC